MRNTNLSLREVLPNHWLRWLDDLLTILSLSILCRLESLSRSLEAREVHTARSLTGSSALSSLLPPSLAGPPLPPPPATEALRPWTSLLLSLIFRSELYRVWPVGVIPASKEFPTFEEKRGLLEPDPRSEVCSVTKVSAASRRRESSRPRALSTNLGNF